MSEKPTAASAVAGRPGYEEPAGIPWAALLVPAALEFTAVTTQGRLPQGLPLERCLAERRRWRGSLLGRASAAASVVLSAGKPTSRLMLAAGRPHLRGRSVS